MAEYPSGIAFPFHFNAAGGVARAEGDAKLWSNLFALVKSNVNERLIRKAVGVIGYSLVLRTAVPGSESVIKGLIEEAVAQFEPRVIIVQLEIKTQDIDGGTARILEVGWRRKTSPEINQETIKLE
jgi:phage baseplate assembly protein W